MLLGVTIPLGYLLLIGIAVIILLLVFKRP